MVLRVIRNVIQYRGQFLYGVNARFQVRNQDLSCGIGGPVQVVAAILDFCDSEGNAGQPGTITAQFLALWGILFHFCNPKSLDVYKRQPYDNRIHLRF